MAVCCEDTVDRFWSKGEQSSPFVLDFDDPNNAPHIVLRLRPSECSFVFLSLSLAFLPFSSFRSNQSDLLYRSSVEELRKTDGVRSRKQR